MYQLFHTQLHDAIYASRLLEKTGLHIRPINDLGELREIPPSGIINGDGYNHVDTLQFVSQLSTNGQITYIHIDDHSDREFTQSWLWGKPDYANFTIPLSRLPHIHKVIYLCIHPKFISRDSHTLEYCLELLNSSEIYSGGNTNFKGSDFFELNQRDREQILKPEIKRALNQNRSIEYYEEWGWDSSFGIFWKSSSEFDPSKIETPNVYVSVDLDVLDEKVQVPTNPIFSRGILTLDGLIRIIKDIKLKKSIVGFDITGFSLHDSKVRIEGAKQTLPQIVGAFY